MKMLNLGCGPVILPEYLNVDIETPEVLTEWASQAGKPAAEFDNGNFLQFDLLQPWSFVDDDSVDTIIANNFLEHFDHAGTHHILSECKRSLAPDGSVRGRVPDFRRVWEAYECDADWDWEPAVTWGPYPQPAANALFNFCYAWGHKQIFTREMLYDRLSQFGFSSVEIFQQDVNYLFFFCRK